LRSKDSSGSGETSGFSHTRLADSEAAAADGESFNAVQIGMSIWVRLHTGCSSAALVVAAGAISVKRGAAARGIHAPDG
jgi:hypothetical protein